MSGFARVLWTPKLRRGNDRIEHGPVIQLSPHNRRLTDQSLTVVEAISAFLLL